VADCQLITVSGQSDIRHIREVLAFRDEHAVGQHESVAVPRLPRAEGWPLPVAADGCQVTHAAAAAWTNGERQA
jgi:hypothetical protein